MSKTKRTNWRASLATADSRRRHVEARCVELEEQVMNDLTHVTHTGESASAHSSGVFSPHLEPSVSIAEMLHILEMRARQLPSIVTIGPRRSNRGNLRSVPLWASRAVEALTINLSDLTRGEVRTMRTARINRINSLVRAEFVRHLLQQGIIEIGKPVPRVSAWNEYSNCQLAGITGMTIGDITVAHFGKLMLTHPGADKKSMIDPMGYVKLISFVRDHMGL